MKVVIVHGTTSRPERSWFPWLTWKLLRSGHDVYVPRLPTPKNQEYSTWKAGFEDQVPGVDENTILIGHSTGTIFLLRYLSEMRQIQKIAGLILASAFAQRLKLPTHPHLEPILNNFVDGPIDWDHLKAVTPVRMVYHGSNDPFVPQNCGQSVAERIGAEFVVIDGGQHLNSEAKYFEFERLYSDLGRIIG